MSDTEDVKDALREIRAADRRVPQVNEEYTSVPREMMRATAPTGWTPVLTPLPTPEKDPTGRDAHAPGAKLDAGKARPVLVLGGFQKAISATLVAMKRERTKSFVSADLPEDPHIVWLDGLRPEDRIPGWYVRMCVAMFYVVDIRAHDEDFRGLGDVVDVGTFGAKKYTDNGWREVPDADNRYYEALGRHLFSRRNVDDQTGLSHMAHATWNALALLELQLKDLRA